MREMIKAPLVRPRAKYLPPASIRTLAAVGFMFLSVFAGCGGSGGTDVPVVSGVSPDSATAGDPAFTLTVFGENFAKSSVVFAVPNALAVPSRLDTTFINSHTLTAVAPPSVFALPDIYQIGVSGASNVIIMSVHAPPAPSLTFLSPSSAVTGGAAFTLTVNGTGFRTTDAISFNNSKLTTTFLSATQLTASVPASAIASAGAFTVTVVTQFGLASGGLPFTVAP
jgi:hypothetical protein